MNRVIKSIISVLISLTLISLFPSKTTHIDIVYPTISQEEKLLLNMSTPEKVGQLFMFGIKDTQISTETISLIKDRYIGGIILFKYNISTLEQLKQLNTDIQSQTEIPIFISIDQEGGIVSRIDVNNIYTKSQKEIVNNQDAYNTAYQRGTALKELGINMNLAPVVEYVTDTNSFMYKRTFNGTLQEITDKGINMVNGYTDSNIISVIKHYPGHSNTHIDSHYQLPVVDIQDWNQYIYPFKYAIENSNIPALMVGHVMYPNIDNKPSTISSEIINKRLRQDLNYKGLIITDDMEMNSIENWGTYTDIAKQSLIAGNDILLYSGLPEVQIQVYDYILKEVEDGNIDISLIDEKVLRILKYKYEYLF